MTPEATQTPDAGAGHTSLIANFVRQFGSRRDLPLEDAPSPGTRYLLHHRDHAPVLARYDGRQELPFMQCSVLQFSLLVSTPEYGNPFTSCLGPSLVASGYYRATPA